MNQKSLDKKKTNIEIVDTDIFSIGTDGGNKPIKPINLDKKKPKELDWDTLGIKEIFSQWLFFNGKLTGKEAEELWNKLSLIFKATLTQQRTELEQQKVKVVWNDVCEQIKKEARTELLDEILGLEILEDEKFIQMKEATGVNEFIESRNQLREEIIDEIKKL